jgi:hypothetical protein
MSAALWFTGPIEVVKNVWAEAFVQISDKALKLDNNSAFQRMYLRFIYRILIRAAWVTRGSKGRNRAAIMVLLRYLFNLFTLGFATVLFWALVIRLNTKPTFMGLGQAILTSSARVLPGIEALPPSQLPQWVETGSSASAWILFVLYAGPAASIFPLIQQAYVNAMSEAHVKFRHAAIALLLHIRAIEIALARAGRVAHT